MGEKTVEEAVKRIKKAEEEIIRLETQSDSAFKTLKEKYNITSIKEGDAYLDKADKKISTMETDLLSKQKKLEEEFPWE